MNEIIGDFWEEAQKDYDAIVCTTNNVIKSNGELVMGAGIAKDFGYQYPWIPEEWGRRIEQYTPYNRDNYYVLVSLLQPSYFKDEIIEELIEYTGCDHIDFKDFSELASKFDKEKETLIL